MVTLSGVFSKNYSMICCILVATLIIISPVSIVF